MSALSGRRLAAYAFCCAVWGSTWLVIKIGLRDLPPFHFAAVRMSLACALLLPVVLRGSVGRLSRTEARWLAVCGLLQIGVSYAFIFEAGRWIDTGLSAILFCTFPLWIGLFAHFWLPEEPLTRRALFASLLGLAGVAVIEGPSVAAAVSERPGPLLIGGLCVLGSSISAAVANVWNKRHFAGISPYMNLWGQTFSGSLFLWLLALGLERGAPLAWTPSALLAMAYLVIFGTLLAFVALFWLIPRVPVAVIGTIPLTDTVLAVILGAVILGEALGARVFAGGLLILIGVVLVAAPRSVSGPRAPDAGSSARDDRSRDPRPA